MSFELAIEFEAMLFCPASIEDEVTSIMASMSLAFDFSTQCAVTCNIAEATLCVARLQASIASVSLSGTYASICV